MIIMENHKHFNVSKKRKDKFKQITMSLKSGLIIILLMILMTKVKVTSGRVYERKYRNHLDVHKNVLPARHYNHYLHKKYKYFGSSYHHVKKASRYPTLDKISNRLDNHVRFHLIDKNNKIDTTTPSHYDDWDLITANATADRNSRFSYITMGAVKDATTDEALIHFRHHESTTKSHAALSAVSSRTLRDLTTQKTRDAESEQDNNEIDSKVSRYGLGADDFFRPTNSEQSDNDVETVRKPTTLSTAAPTFSTTIATRSSASRPRHQRPPLPPNRQLSKHERKAKEIHSHLESYGKCDFPKPKVIHVQEEFPDPSVKYSPTCAVLHRCGPDTGCCNNDSLVCTARESENVTLTFEVKYLHHRPDHVNLTFKNDSRCECRPKIKKPKCPQEFTERYYPNRTNACDCFDQEIKCLSLKNGWTQFSESEHKCIAEKKCLPPSCKHGSYNQAIRSCPKDISIYKNNEKREKKTYSIWKRLARK